MPDDRVTTDQEVDAASELRRSFERPTSSDELETLINRAIMCDIDAILERVSARLIVERREMDALLVRMNIKPLA